MEMLTMLFTAQAQPFPKKITALGLALGLGVSGAIASGARIAPATAQEFSTPSRQVATAILVNLPTGSPLPVEYDEAEKILVAPDEVLPLTVTLGANIRDRYGRLLLPYGTVIEGEIRPVDGGSQFVASRLVFSDREEPYQELAAEGPVIDRTETIKEGANTGDILEGAAIGAGAAILIGTVTGDVSLGEVIGGAVLGSLGGLVLGGGEAEVLVFDPAQDLDLTLTAPLPVAVDRNGGDRYLID